MDIQSSKIELTKLILDIEDPVLIEKIRGLLIGKSSDFWESLSDYEKREIELGIKQLDEGKGTLLDDFFKEVS